MAFSRRLLSGSTNGRPIAVAAVATPGTLIHTAITGTVGFDELYLFAANVTAAAQTLTIEWGGVGDPADHLVKSYSIPAYSAPIPIAPGLVVNGGVAVRAFSDSASSINITGFVNRIQ